LCCGAGNDSLIVSFAIVSFQCRTNLNKPDRARRTAQRSGRATLSLPNQASRLLHVDCQTCGRDTLYHHMGENVQPFRRHPRYLLVALLAFVAQITLAFAHVHVCHGHSSWIRAAATDGETIPLPSDDDGDCRICVAIHVASTLIPSAGPELILPRTTYYVACPVYLVQPRAATRASPFQSRAPPQPMNV